LEEETGMAEYFEDREDAEKFMNEWYAKDNKPPVFFGKIFNNDAEKWIVNYDARQDPRASPFIKVLENHSHEINTIVTTPWSQLQQELQRLREREEQQKKERKEQEERQNKEREERQNKERKERERVDSIKQRRKADGVCVMCGNKLGFLLKILRETQHVRCETFLES
jgi:DNA repair exonuclease SbcCD ATPase subunit